VVSSQSEDETVSLLQNLADMDITYKALQVKLLFSFPFVGLAKGRNSLDGCFLRQKLKDWNVCCSVFCRRRTSAGMSMAYASTHLVKCGSW
jgi:hypothetical protein